MKKLLPSLCALVFLISGLGLRPAFAEVECITPDGRTESVTSQTRNGASAFLKDEETLSCPLQQGRTTFVIKLPSAAALDRFTFVNENESAAGQMKISVSNDQLPAASPKWVDVDGAVAFAHKRLFNLSMVGVDARYVRLSFNVESGGRIAGADLNPGRQIDHSVWNKVADQQIAMVSKMTRARRWAGKRDFDYANVGAKARVVYVSSGTFDGTRQMIDQKKETGYTFSRTDRHPTVIVELAADEEIHRVTAQYRLHTPGRLDVYLLNDVSKSATDLNYQTPIASVADEDGDGNAAVDFDPEGARYVAVRFTPVDSLGGDRPFEIVEIDVFGGASDSVTDAMEAPELYATKYTAAPFPGTSTGSPDISSSLGTLAIPPVLPDVSP